jgi:phage shock protein PspC (stress-responsive transcriptional regulator)
MKKFLEILRSERRLVAGVFRRLADEFAWDRAATRIVGVLILLAGPYALGASFRYAWLFSILGYFGLMIFIRWRGNLGQGLHPDSGWTHKEQRYPRTFSGCGCEHNSGDARFYSTSEMNNKSDSVPSQAAGSPADNFGASSGQQLGEILLKLEQRLARLDQRIQKMESVVTDRSFDWDRRLRNG